MLHQLADTSIYSTKAYAYSKNGQWYAKHGATGKDGHRKAHARTYHADISKWLSIMLYTDRVREAIEVHKRIMQACSNHAAYFEAISYKITCSMQIMHEKLESGMWPIYIPKLLDVEVWSALLARANC